ncbi:MAG TPA: hypothetical protein PLN69_12310, partial [bacterium]|nr:hypothetical protein [bacterium]
DIDTEIEKIRKSRTRAFYDIESGEVVFNRDAETPGWNSPLVLKTMETLEANEIEFVLAHQLGYALADQNYGLKKILSGGTRNSDAMLAAQAMAHGDAVLMTLEHLVRNYGVSIMMLPDVEAIVSQFLPLVTYIDRDWFANAPESISRTLEFPEAKGLSFAIHLRKQGGFPLLNSAYESVPLSTEQVLHPEKFFEKRDNPVEIVMPRIEKAVPESRLLYEDVLGEWGIRLLLSGWLGNAGEAARAAEGWGGDRFAVYEKADGGRVGVLITTWDSAGDASMFEGVLKRAARKALAGRMEFEIQLIGMDVVALFEESGESAAEILSSIWEFGKSPVMVGPPVPKKPTPEFIQSDISAFLSMFKKENGVRPGRSESWQEDDNRFTNAKYGYTVVKPGEDWQFQRLHLGNQFISEFTAINGKKMGSNFTIFTFEKYGDDVENPVEEMVEFMSRQMKQYKFLGEEKTTVGGLPARRVTFQGFIFVPLKIAYTEVFGENYNYIITWWALKNDFDLLMPDFEAFTDSFNVVK